MFSTGVYIGVVRVALAAVFLFSGFAKLFSPQPAAAFVADVLGLSSNNSFAIVVSLSLFELALGFAFLAGFKLRVVSFLSSLFLLAALVVGLVSVGEDRSCGCFGELLESKTDEVFVVRTLGLIFLSLIVLHHSSPQISKPNQKDDEQTQRLSYQEKSL
jgi:uncharacterized membrane protein YphA (DoxX/SURF4 family)